MTKLFPKNTIEKTPPHYFEHNHTEKERCKFCAKTLDFEIVSADLYAYRTMYYSKNSPREWVCKDCFEKFNAKYKWHVEEYDWRINGWQSFLVGKKLKIVDVLEFYTASCKEWDGKTVTELHDHDHL